MKRLVHFSTLRALFRGLGYLVQIQAGVAQRGRPLGTKIEILPYLLNGVKITFYLQYTCPDGTIGASGKPDPKFVRHKNVEFYCHDESCLCAVCAARPENWRTLV